MTKIERAYRKALSARARALEISNERYARACDRATAASVALGEIDPNVRTRTYEDWKAEQ